VNGPEILHLIRHDLQRAVAGTKSPNPLTHGRIALVGDERLRPEGQLRGRCGRMQSSAGTCTVHDGSRPDLGLRRDASS
jgi:hypothetical protein